MVELATGTVRGVEALMRWQHPTRGLLGPDDFIGLAEETGSIVALGERVLDIACRQVRAWQAEFPRAGLRLSVNMSPVQILQSGVVETVAAALDRSGLPSSSLVLELTEEVMIKDLDVCALRLRELKQLGVHLAVDDFGTGYSSLNYLTHLPFDVLKIDKDFIDDVTPGSKAARVAAAILELGNSFGLTTVAEGIERQEQADALRALGCRFAQGYLFAKPLPAEEIPAYLRLHAPVAVGAAS
jgi:EAL domain-containing protein (putative c-di-GMP-specific phosphodiesterase class I)